MDREVIMDTLGEDVPTYLKWLKTAITFDGKDQPDHIPQPGHFPLVIDSIISKTHLSYVLMDGGSSLIRLYAETYDAMGLSQEGIRPSSAPFHGVIPRL